MAVTSIGSHETSERSLNASQGRYCGMLAREAVDEVHTDRIVAHYRVMQNVPVVLPIVPVVLPIDNPRTAELSALARVVSMRRRMVFRKLPEKATPAGVGGRPLVAGVPLASDRGAERVLFAVVNPGAGW